MTLFWHPTGPLIKHYKGYDGSGILEIRDLNPEMHTQWLMSRWEMIGLGLRCIVAAFRR